MGPNDWTWEDLEATSDHSVTRYKIYRSEDGPTGSFDCVEQLGTNVWAGGDPATPNVGQVYFYIITATQGTEESHPGDWSDGTKRTVNASSPCL